MGKRATNIQIRALGAVKRYRDVLGPHDFPYELMVGGCLCAGSPNAPPELQVAAYPHAFPGTSYPGAARVVTIDNCFTAQSEVWCGLCPAPFHHAFEKDPPNRRGDEA